MGRPPARGPPELAAVDRVTRDMAGTVRDPGDPAPRQPERINDRAGDLEGGAAVAGPDVERLTVDPAPPEEREQGRAVVLHVDPLPPVPAGPVHREPGADDPGHAEQRDRLLRVLIGAVVVHAAGDDDREAIRRVVRKREAVRARFARGVRALRVQRGVLAGGPATALPVHFVRRDVQESVHALAPRGLEHRMGPEHVRPHEVPRLRDRTVHVSLGREVDNRITRAGCVPGARVADVPLDELDPPAVEKVAEVLGIRRVRELVEDDDVVPLADRQAHEVRSDEPRPARHQEAHDAR